jgi:spore maturation protein CgeB
MFEALGRGGFLIFPHIEGIRSHYTENELVTYEYGNFTELKQKIDYYIEHDEERELIRKAGHERTKC